MRVNIPPPHPTPSYLPCTQFNKTTALTNLQTTTMESKGAVPPDGVLLDLVVTETTHTITRRAAVMMLNATAAARQFQDHDDRGSVETTRVVTQTTTSRFIPQMMAGPLHCGRRGVREQLHAGVSSTQAEGNGFALDRAAGELSTGTGSGTGALTTGGVGMKQAARVDGNHLMGANIATMLPAAAPVGGARVAQGLTEKTITRMAGGFADDVATGQHLFLQRTTRDTTISANRLTTFISMIAGGVPLVHVLKFAVSLLLLIVASMLPSRVHGPGQMPACWAFNSAGRRVATRSDQLRKAVFLFAATLLILPDKTRAPVPPPKTFRIGLMSPLYFTGEAVVPFSVDKDGHKCLAAAIMAIEEINNKTDGILDDIL